MATWGRRSPVGETQRPLATPGDPMVDVLGTVVGMETQKGRKYSVILRTAASC